jgi:SAM-dependent methyltransferase
MHPSLNQEQLSVIEQNVSYYDEIAAQYDELLDRDSLNGHIRQKVASLFAALVPAGLVLDFGGGTGKDLGWLIENGYRIIFCEPSVNMREKAIAQAQKNLPPRSVRFLENNVANFTTWEAELPFSEKVNAVLANFAVINSIPDIQLLFSNLSLVIQPGGHVFMLALKAGLTARWRFNRLATLLSFVTQNTVRGNIRFKRQQQQVYLHPVKKIRKAAAAGFRFVSSETFNENDFVLIHLTRK